MVVSKARQNESFSIVEATFLQLGKAMETGNLTSRELVQAYFSRIEAYDRQGPMLQSMLALNPCALEQAERLDEERRRHGPRGPLHGIPIVVKDNYNTQDMPTTCGTPHLAGFVPSEDCRIVQNLRNAGAIILGKTNLHEMALFGLTHSAVGGQTRNPYDGTKTPGGSSGGTGAAVSANFAAAGTGTDTVNSVRSPASANSLTGIRPTKGLMDLEGIIPVSSTQDNAGPIARTVEDAALLLEAMAGGGYCCTDGLHADGLRGTRIGVLHSFFGQSPEHEEVNRVTEVALKLMRDLGSELVDLTPVQLQADRLLQEMDVQRFEIRDQLERYFADYGAPVKSLEEFLAKGKYDPQIEAFLKSVIAIEDPLNHPEYKARLNKIGDLKTSLSDIFEKFELDAIVYPHQKRLVVDIGEASQSDRNGILAALTGFPAVTFPGGFSSPTPTAPLGIPIGIEYMGKPGDDPKLIRMACAFESAAKHRKMPILTVKINVAEL